MQADARGHGGTASCFSAAIPAVRGAGHRPAPGHASLGLSLAHQVLTRVQVQPRGARDEGESGPRPRPCPTVTASRTPAVRAPSHALLSPPPPSLPTRLPSSQAPPLSPRVRPEPVPQWPFKRPLQHILHGQCTPAQGSHTQQGAPAWPTNALPSAQSSLMRPSLTASTG